MSEKPKTITQYLVAVVAAGFAFATGIALGWSNPIEPKAKEGDLGFDVGDELFSWIGAALPLGAVISCMPTGFLIDAIGRRSTGLFLFIPYTFGWLAIIFANESWLLILGRAFIGIASGACCVCIPMYIGEIAQKEVRGTLSSFFQLGITIGVMFVYIIGAFFKPLVINVVSAIFPILFGIGMFFVPESPLYLVKKDRMQGAEKSYSCLRGKNYDPQEEIKTAKEDNLNKRSGSVFAGFKNPACLRALYISIGLMFIQQFSGINAVIFYSTEIFKLAGSTLEPRFSTIVIGVTQVVSTLIAVMFVDRLGRRLLLLTSAAVMALSTLVLGVYFYLKDNEEDAVDDLGFVPIASLCLYIITFSLGFGPVPWIMTAELFPSEVKGPAGSLSGTSNWLFAFIVSKVYPSLKTAIGTGETFWVFSALTIIGFIFVLFLVPETKNKSLPEIQDMLSH